jgi:hypothetical protein
MQELTARAALVSAPDVAGGLSTPISRKEIEEALRAGDSSPELILDVTRYDDGESAETRSVSVVWERDDLEQLLRQTEGERVLLTFDGKTLADAMAADVDAHGLREKVLVLTVAATTAAGLAASAQARVDAPADGGGTQAAAQVGVSPDSRTLPATEGQVGVSPDSRTVATTTEGQVGVSPDSRAVPFGVTEQPTGVSPDDRAVPPSTPVETPTVSVPDDGFTFDPSPVQIVGIAGAMMLAITGAAFLLAGRRRGVQPA